MIWLSIYLLGYAVSCALFLRSDCQEPLFGRANRWILSYSLAWPIWAYAIGSEKVKRWLHARKRRDGR